MQIGRCKWHDDEDGRYVDVRVDAADGTLVFGALRHLAGADEAAIAGRTQNYRGSSGEFLVSTKVEEERARLYVPWNAVEPSKASGSQLFLLIAVNPDSDDSVSQRYPISLVPKSAYSKFEVLKPMIGQGLAVAYADGVLQQSEVRCLKDIFINTLGLAGEDIGRLKDLMYHCPPNNVRPLAHAALYRSATRSPAPLLQVLQLVAAADGRITDDEIAVIEQVADELRADPAIVRGIRQAAGEAQQDPWAFFGLARDAAEAAVKAAYRQKIAEYHPDKWASAPQKFLHLANEETRRATAAYAAITNARAARTEGGLPRPEGLATYATYGVRQQFEWTEWSPYQPRPRPAPPPSPPLPAPPRSPPPPALDPLAGVWADANGNRTIFIPDVNGYRIQEYSVLGLVSEGWATRVGADVQCQVRNMLMGQFTTQLRINGSLLVGHANLMGMPMPVALYRA